VRENQIKHAELLIAYEFSLETLNSDSLNPIQLAHNLSYPGILAMLENPTVRQKLQLTPKATRTPRIVAPYKEPEPAPPAPKPQPEQPAKTGPASPQAKKKNSGRAGRPKPADSPKPVFPEPVAFAQPLPQVYPGSPGAFGAYGPQGQVMVPLDELISVQKRILILEELASQLLAGQGPACLTCKAIAGTAKCPVCSGMFCGPDWAAHVANGCQPK
jgi:hypothetical protein